MSSRVYEYAINFVSSGFESVKKMAQASENIGKGMGNAQKAAQKASGALAGVGKSSALTTFAINQVGTGLQTFNDSLQGMTAPGKAFNASMADLKAVTGASDEALVAMGESARGLSKEFGGSAAGQVESYKLLLSRLTPEIADKPEALALMGRNVSLLSKTMGGDAVGATEAMTTAMNQFGVDLSDPQTAAMEMTRMMDIMSASALAGSAEVPQIAGALKTAGLVAKNAGLSFEETNAAIQVLGKGSLYGSEAGIALRNVLATMAQGEFFPKESLEALQKAGVNIDTLGNKSLSLNQRLSELKKIQGDSALMSKVFGKENESAAALLIGNTAALTDYTQKASLANATQIQAEAQMGSYNEQMSRIWATTQDWGISMFDATKSMLPMVEVMGAAGQQAVGIVGGFTAVRDIIGVTKKLFTMETLEVVANSFAKVGNLMTTTALGVGSGLASAGVWALTTAQTALNAAFVASPWGWVALAIGAVVAAIVWAYNEFDAFRELIDSIGKGLKSAFTTAAKFFGWNVGEDKATATAKVATPPKVAEPPKTQTELQKVAETTKKETKDKKTKTSADSIMAGGTKAINIKFDNVKFADKVEIMAQTMDGAIDDVEFKFKQMFARVLNGSMMVVDQ